MTKSPFPRTIVVCGKVLTQTPHPNPAFTAWVGRTDGASISVLYSMESDYRSQFWHVSVARTPEPPTMAMLSDAVHAIAGTGVTYETERTPNPNVLHAFEPEAWQ